MIAARQEFAGRLEFVEIGDFESSSPRGLDKAVQGVDAIIHTASVRKNLLVLEHVLLEGHEQLTSLTILTTDIHIFT